MISCSSTDLKKELNGNWYYSDGDKVDFQLTFYEDTLVMMYDFGVVLRLKWKSDADSIYMQDAEKFGPTYKYELDTDNQKLKLSNSRVALNLLKANDVDEFVFDEIIGLKIELPLYKQSLSRSEYRKLSNPHYWYIPIYAGYNNDKLIVKTKLSSNLNSIEKVVNELRDNSRDEIKNRLKFNLIADKNITVRQLDSIKDRLRETPIKRVFRAYKTQLLNDMNEKMWVSIEELN